jgi:dihydropteroate synthase
MKPLIWKTSCREIAITRPLVMGIVNVTPDSFSDGGRYSSVELALGRVEQMIADGAAVIDIGGESTRPGSRRVDINEEIRRTVPVIQEIAKRFSTPISIDTAHLETAAAAIHAGAEIVNDISGLRFDDRIGELAARVRCGLILMHSRGTFDSMHSQEPVQNIVTEVTNDFRRAIKAAHLAGVSDDQIVLDVGLGFGKSFEQNLELIAKLDKIVYEFDSYPMLIGPSRKSFVGRILDGADPDKRLGGSVSAALEAAKRGAAILRVHDVKETVDALKMMSAVKDFE